MAARAADPEFECLLRGTRESAAGRMFRRLYRFNRLRRLCFRGAIVSEGNRFLSASLRGILADYHGVRVGAYSYGPCLVPGMFPAGVTIGRYVSIARHVQVVLRNHPMDRLSTHPFFFNRNLGYVAEDATIVGTLEIGHDAWIGENAMVAPSCRRIGDGAVIAAGAVVTKDVPDFAIVGGVPAKLIRMRFDEAEQAYLREVRWWDLTMEELRSEVRWFERPAREAVEAGALRRTEDARA